MLKSHEEQFIHTEGGGYMKPNARGSWFQIWDGDLFLPFWGKSVKENTKLCFRNEKTLQSCTAWKQVLQPHVHANYQPAIYTNPTVIPRFILPTFSSIAPDSTNLPLEARAAMSSHSRFLKCKLLQDTIVAQVIPVSSRGEKSVGSGRI